jgi:hypothetical protein
MARAAVLSPSVSSMSALVASRSARYFHSSKSDIIKRLPFAQTAAMILPTDDMEIASSTGITARYHGQQGHSRWSFLLPHVMRTPSEPSSRPGTTFAMSPLSLSGHVSRVFRGPGYGPAFHPYPKEAGPCFARVRDWRCPGQPCRPRWLTLGTQFRESAKITAVRRGPAR